MAGSGVITSFLGNLVPSAAFGSQSLKNTYMNGNPNQTNLSSDIARAGQIIVQNGILSPSSYVKAGINFSQARSSSLGISVSGYEDFLLNTPGFILPNSDWSRAMNQSTERTQSADPVDLITDEFGPAAANDFKDLPPAAQRMMIFQAQLNKADRVNKAMTERIQRLHSMLMDIIRNFKG